MKRLICFIILLILPVAVLTDDEVFFMLWMDPCIMIILDSSGSMTWDMAGNATCGDGSIVYQGRDTNLDGFADDSRLYIVKRALRDITTENTQFQFGLMTYGQDYEWTNLYSYGGGNYANWYWPYYCSGCTWNWYPPYKYQYGYYTAYMWWWGMTWPTSYPDYAHYPLRVPVSPHTPAHRDSILAWIDNDCGYPSIEDGDHEIRACGSTPIGGSLYWVREYYRLEYIPNDPARNCRRYFVLLVSDGEEQEWTLNPYTWASNLRSTKVFETTHDIQTFALGIGENMSGSPMLDSLAKLGGTQRAHFATTPEALDTAFAAILGDVYERSFSFSAPEVPAVRVKQQDKLYMGSFLPSYDIFWKGYLKCYQLNPDGSLPVDSQGVPLNLPLWEAGKRLQSTSSNSRNIYTEVNGSLVPFIPAFIDSTMLGVPGNDVTNLINWVRGDNGMNWKLGDIFHSEPLGIMNPNPFYNEEGYNEFKVTYENRDRIILAGANDGMLHAFDAGIYSAGTDSFSDGSGDELWAFIPHNLLSKLKNMRNSHQYMVDGSPGAAGVWIPSGPLDITKDADEWKTILVCGERSGGNHYFSLDITDTHSPSYMWEFTDTELSETWSGPLIRKVRVPRDKWVTVFGGGFHPDNEKGRALYILDISDGNIVFKFDSTVNANIQYCFPSRPIGIDLSPIDKFMDRIYIGDVSGQMWRFNVSDTSVSSWSSQVIFASEPIAPRVTPIFYPPSLSYDEEGNLWVFFGTGDREDPRNVDSFERFYGIIDRGVLLRESDLAEITHGGNPPSDDGWFIKLERGEKVLAGSAVISGTVYFTTYKCIDTDDPCEIQGLARLYKVDFLEGTVTFETIGTSLPTTPQITISPEGYLTIMITLAEGKIFTEVMELPASFKETIYWKEIRP